MSAVTRERVEELRDYVATLRTPICPEIVAALTRLLALEDARWVPWMPGDALPATAPVLHWTTWFDKEYTDVPMMRANHAHDFERWNVIAYWSVPLPAPYDEALAGAGRWEVKPWPKKPIHTRDMDVDHFEAVAYTYEFQRADAAMERLRVAVTAIENARRQIRHDDSCGFGSNNPNCDCCALEAWRSVVEALVVIGPLPGDGQ